MHLLAVLCLRCRGRKSIEIHVAHRGVWPHLDAPRTRRKGKQFFQSDTQREILSWHAKYFQTVRIPSHQPLAFAPRMASTIRLTDLVRREKTPHHVETSFRTRKNP